jgi:hypothetical protein
MIFNFEEKPSDSPYVEVVWRNHSESGGHFISMASSHWQMVITKHEGKTKLTVRGPETKATPAVLRTSPNVTTTPTTWEQPDESDERVEFEPGISSTTRSGALVDSESKEYVLSAAAGQAIHIETVGYNAPVNFTLTGPAGETWSGEPHASEVYIFRAQVVLSQDGDYVATLSVPPNAVTTRYDVVFTIDPSYAPERVELETGDYLITLTKADHTPSTHYTVDFTIQ